MNSTYLHRELIDRFEELREAAGVSRREVARRLGVSQATIQETLTEGGNASLATIERLYAAIDLRLDFKSKRDKTVRVTVLDDGP